MSVAGCERADQAQAQAQAQAPRSQLGMTGGKSASAPRVPGDRKHRHQTRPVPSAPRIGDEHGHGRPQRIPFASTARQPAPRDSQHRETASTARQPAPRGHSVAQAQAQAQAQARAQAQALHCRPPPVARTVTRHVVVGTEPSGRAP